MEDSPDVKLGLMVCGSGWYQYVQLITGDKTIFEPFGYFFLRGNDHYPLDLGIPCFQKKKHAVSHCGHHPRIKKKRIFCPTCSFLGAPRLLSTPSWFPAELSPLSFPCSGSPDRDIWHVATFQFCWVQVGFESLDMLNCWERKPMVQTYW